MKETRADGGRHFVGRRSELETIESAVRDALAGKSSVLFVTGEAGIGKSRMAEEAGVRAEALGATLFRGRCWDSGGAPAYWPWIQIVRAIAERGRVPLSSELERLSATSSLPEALCDEERPAFFEGVRDALRAVSATTPLVLVLEDLHAADLPTLELLRTIADGVSGARLVVIGTYRETEVRLDAGVSRLLAQITREAEVLRLPGFAEKEIATFLRSRFPRAAAGSVVSSLRRMTGGNPLFLEEMLSLVSVGETLDESRLVNLRIPDHIQDVIARRLEVLPAVSRKLLATASVVGPEFDLEILVAAAGGGKGSAGLLAAPEEAGIVRAERSSPARYAFTHDLFREVLYRSLSAPERLELHGVIGAALEEDTEHRASHAELAYHFVQAAPIRGRGRAIYYSEIAGREAMSRLAWESAARHFEQALAMAELSPEEPAGRRCALLLRLGEASWAAGAFERSKKAFRKAFRLAQEVSRPEVLARAALGTSGHTLFLDMGAGGVDAPRTGLLAKALEALPAEDSTLRARLLARLCAAMSLTPEVDRRRELATEAVSMARRLGKEDALADVLHAASWGTWGPDALEERLRVSEEVIDLAGRTGRSDLLMLTRYRRLHHFLEAADAGAAARELEESRRLAKRLPQTFYCWVAALQEAVWATVCGDFDAAERHSGEALRIGQEDENPNALRLFGIQNVFVLRERGRLDEIVGLVESMVAALPDFPAWRAALAWTYAEIGKTEEARRELDILARNDFAGIPRDLFWLACLWGISETVVRLDDRSRAEILYRLLASYADRCLAVYSGAFGGSMVRLLGSLAALLGRFDAAAAHFAEAHRTHERMGARSWTAHTRFDEARALLRRGRASDRRRAEELLTTAGEEARELGMAALERRIESLDRAGKTRPKRSRIGNVFRLEGDYWTIQWQEKRIAEPDLKGLGYLAKLLAHPGREIHVMELAGGEAAAGAAHREERGPTADTTLSPGIGDAGELLDARAAASYRSRLRQLEGELRDADGTRAKEIREEMDFLERELAAAHGLGGRRRKAGDTTDRARKAVTSRIRHALARIEDAHPRLGRHFAASVRLGVFCAYDPKQGTVWDV